MYLILIFAGSSLLFYLVYLFIRLIKTKNIVIQTIVLTLCLVCLCITIILILCVVSIKLNVESETKRIETLHSKLYLLSIEDKLTKESRRLIEVYNFKIKLANKHFKNIWFKDFIYPWWVNADTIYIGKDYNEDE